MKNEKPLKGWKAKIHEIIYGTHTPAGKLFDILLLVLIMYSILIVMLESVPRFDTDYHEFFNISEWVVTILFSIEYILRIICINRPKKYIFSFFGIIDFLSTVPKYLSFFFMGSQYFTAFRALRLLRVFRILKLVRFVGESNKLANALKASRTKISVFVFFVLIVSVLLGTLMYLIEGPQHGFNSIPHSVYWTIVTLTTVGYGDISPQTPLGQFLATLIMIIGYGIIAVPTGIVSAEYASNMKQNKSMDEGRSCPNCSAEVHRSDADYCRKCGYKLEEDEDDNTEKKA
ncbi:ion transporter [Cellulophaga fucicola]|uniref:Voltage-gated potassium channel n=1 Tax=Cellulophaga fucicola TaxID=76595 RepID=A0A1K1MV40_9FLAO|nr:ion transporter [Cellulophaga fucicola]SFW26937.1 voltage-gated potassium channel [Cellulophaga fucicola]